MIRKIVIIEDESLNAERLIRLLHSVRPQATILIILDSIADSIAWFAANEAPDLILMDIRLADGLSFDLLDRIKNRAPIVFTTAYDEYAVRAFKYNALDYLLKPVEQDELEAALKRVESTRSLLNQQKSIETMMDYLKPREYRNRLLIPFRDSYKTLTVNDIRYIHLDTKITKATLSDGNEVILNQTLEELERELDPRYFFRANRQVIVHVQAVKQIHHYFNGKMKIALKNDDFEILVSREKASALKAWLDF